MREKIILGTAQLGLAYGIRNSSGVMPVEEAHRLLKAAYDSGIRMLDTAAGYGTAHQVIGDFHRAQPERFKICTKFSSGVSEEELAQSLKTLEVTALHAVSLHGVKDRTEMRGEIKTLSDLKKSGAVEKIGVSLYDNDEIREAAEIPEIDIIQIPFNLLDNTARRGAVISLAKSNGKLIHARSVFLQGIFYGGPDEVPARLEALHPAISALTKIAAGAKLSLAEMALNYAYWNEGIAGVIIGVESAEQLADNLRMIGKSLPANMLASIDKISVASPNLIDPRTW